MPSGTLSLTIIVYILSSVIMPFAVGNGFEQQIKIYEKL